MTTHMRTNTLWPPVWVWNLWTESVKLVQPRASSTLLIRGKLVTAMSTSCTLT